jgi:hypothetical protein
MVFRPCCKRKYRISILGHSGLSHLLFADDSLLFFWANVGEAARIHEMLNTGQLINLSKGYTSFGDSCSQEVREEVKNVLGVTQETFRDQVFEIAYDGRTNE